MTDEKIIKLSEEELDMVSGGAEYKDAFLTKREDGKYTATLCFFEGSADDYKALMTGGEVPSISIGVSIASYVVSPDKLDMLISRWEKRGYTIHR